MKTSHPNNASDRGSVQDVKKSAKPISMIEKILNDKAAIEMFFNGEISGNELNAKGIKLVKAI